MLATLTSTAPHLPPDWSTVTANGTNPQPRASPGGVSPRYGYEAARVLVQLAVDCRASGQAIAARAWPFLRREASGTLEAEYTLAGEPLGRSTHPLGLVAAAASAAAAGASDDAARLLDAADAHDDRFPTYYGAAWIALARLWLDTDLIGGCRPGDPTS
jgi:endoglucanase